MQLYLFNFFNDEMLSFYTLFSLSQVTDRLLLTDLIKNAYSITVTASLTS